MLRWAYLSECVSPPNGWKVCSFTKVAEVIAGQSPESSLCNERGQGIPFLQGNAEFASKYPKPTKWCTSPAKLAKTGDTLLSVRAPVGEVNRADQDYGIGRGLAAIRGKGLNQDFLHQGLQRWRWCLQRVAQGTTFDAITARHFNQLTVAVPESIDEQAAIALVLDAVDSTIEQVRTIVERTAVARQAVLQHFFYDALGETAYADRAHKPLPERWALVPTAELLAEEPKNGISPKASSQPPGIPTFSIAAVRDGRVDLKSGEHLKYAQLPLKVAQQFQVRQGDLLIVRGNANPDLVGKAGIISDFPEGCIYPDITKRVVFRTQGEHTVMPEYGILAWNHSIVHNQVLRRAKTSNGTLKINSRDVKQIVLPVPPRNEQESIVRLIAAVEAKTDALKAKLTALEQLKKSLMADLLSGNARIDPKKIHSLLEQ